MEALKGPLCGWLLCLVSFQLFVAKGVFGQSEGDVRLVDGPNPYEGRPEYFHDGVWLSLCASYMDNEVPQVICTQLGFPSAGAVKYYANSYGDAPGETFRRRIYCGGSEASLSECSISGDEQNCDPRYTLGVSCNTTTSATKIRLRGGSSPYEGRLEIFINGVWGTVCRNFGDNYVPHLITATVACREVFGTGYGGAYYPAYETPSRFGILQSGAIHLRYVQCNGDEDSLLDCSSYSAGTYTSCHHEDDATVKCVPVPEGCGGYFKAETGTVTSPGYPTGHNYTDYTNCVWKIETTPYRKIKISFSDVQAHETGDANYIQVLGRSGYTAYRTSYGSDISDYTGTANVVYIRQTTAAGHVGIDFQASWVTPAIDCNSTYSDSTAYIRSVGYSNNYPPGLDCYHLVQYREQFTASLYFYGFHLDDEVNGTCQDYVEIFDGATISDTSLGRFCNATRPPILTSSQNVVLIHFHSDDVIDDTSGGFYLRVSGVEPDPVVTNLTGASGTLATPGYPHNYTNETDYEWIITVLPYNSVTLTFLDFETSCSFSTRLLIQEGHPSGNTLASLCGTGVPTPVMSNTNVMYLRLQSTPGVTTGNHFRATWRAECRRNFTSTSGTIVSPESPNPYPDNLDCVYVITLETGYYIELTFTSFNLDGSSYGECHDFVKIYDGSSEFSPVLAAPFCEASLPLAVNTSGNSLWISFRSDGVSNPASTGFIATYVGHIKECKSQTLTANEGSFTSPGYPLAYPRYTYCVWTITVANNHIVDLTFDNFAIGRNGNYDCSGAYVRLYDGDSVDPSTVIETLCGTTVLPKITSTGRSLTVVLNSFAASPAEAIGFNASYRISASAATAQYALFPFGDAEGDDVLDQSSQSISHVTIDDGFPFGDQTEHDVYIGTNGLVAIGNNYPWPELPDLRNVICVYCAYIDNTDSVGGIYHHLYGAGANDTDVLLKASNEVQEFTESGTFAATMVLVVTWDRVRQGRYRLVDFNPNQDEGEATLQLALISDGLTSYALVYYAFGEMNWTYRGLWSYVIMGVSDGTVDNYQRNLYTKTKRAYRIDGVPGNTGRRGMWLYKTGEVPPNPKAVCVSWFFRNKLSIFDRLVGFAGLPECPCSHRDVWRKTRYLWVKHSYDQSTKVQCYRMNRANSNRHYPYGKTCCYSLDPADPVTYGRVILSAPNAGHALAYNPSYWHLKELYEREDKEAHDACCDPSLVLSDHGYCSVNFYLFLRPIGDCRADIPFRFTWLYGDPHIITLDEREYTFNGWGEYTLIDVTSGNVTFVLQGRTSHTVTDSGSVVSATVFTAFGTQENGTRVFVELDPNTNNSLIIYAADTDYSRRFHAEGDDFIVDDDNFMLMRDNGSLVVTFPSGISLSVSVGIRSLIGSISVPEEFRNQTKGLVGNYNKVKEDEFVLPDGTVLSDTLTDRRLHQQFGNAWAVTEESSVLRYGPREGPSDYAHPEFTPLFKDEMTAAQRQAGENLCGASDTACIYDYVVSNSETFAMRTKQTRETAMGDNADIKNSLPDLQVPDNVTMTSNVPTKFSILATDRDVGDTVTYKLVHDGNGALQIDSLTGEITATVDSQQPVDIRVYALDSHNAQSAVRSILVIVCSGCNGHGDCDFNNVQKSGGGLYFQYAVCVCSAGWTGADCSEDYDACLSSPCHPLQTCTDLTPDQQRDSDVGYTCTPCPAGYTSPAAPPVSVHPHKYPHNKLYDDDEVMLDVLRCQMNLCLDVDECEDEELNDCQTTCNNTAGSYQCSCSTGFRLAGDLRSCADVNECAEKSDDCQQVCNNTEGGYQCLCEDGYTLINSMDCVQTHESQTICADSGCSQSCRAVQDPSANSLVPLCFCHSGYDLDPTDNKTCVDHDECEDGLCTQACNNTEGGFICSCYGGLQLNADQRTCSPCPSLQYGPECLLTCTCSGHGLDCHPVTGCVCRSGWTGSQCQDDVDECEENPNVCSGGQVCSNNNGSYTCACREGYSINDDGICQDVDECSTRVACRQHERCSNVPGSFFCSCLTGYQKVNRTCADIDECAANTDDCQQHCINVDGAYNCDCHYGYRLNGDRSTCSKISDLCAEVENLSCDHGCTLDSTDRAMCFCNTGYRLQTDKQTCTDIDECSESANTCSHTCKNTDGGFTCSCPSGMMLDNDDRTCVTCPSGTYGANCSNVCACGAGASHCDVITGCVCMTGWTGDKCHRDVNECDVESTRQQCESKGARCVNFDGGFRCQCDQGYTMDNDTGCQDIDECSTSPCSQTCENSPGSYRCLCNNGFSLDSSTGECTDIDECSLSSTHACTQSCYNTAGSYRCSCDVAGYVLNNDGVTCSATRICTRTDCDVGNGGCYVNDDDIETCFCNVGYTLVSDGVTCTQQQADPCADGVCDDTCQLGDDVTSFTCSCGDGFLLNDDSRTCRACPQGTFGRNCDNQCLCDAGNTASCDQVSGSCSCKPGWRGVTCTDDVNECQSSPCGDHATCSNTAGSHLCSCDTGYTQNTDGVCKACPNNAFGDGCAQTCDCTGKNVQSCDPVDGTCRCEAGWEGSSCDDDVDECASDNLNDCSDTDHIVCQNTDGGFTCVCQEGFEKDSNDVCIAVTRVPFTTVIHVTVSHNDLTVEPAPTNIRGETRRFVFSILRRFMSRLVGVRIHSLRRGSLIVSAEALVPSDNVRSSASSLAVALMDINGLNATVAGQTGPMSITVGDVTVNSTTTPCDVLTRCVTCEDECQMVDNVPDCKVKGTDPDPLSDGTLSALVIGLAVGIPSFIVAVFLLCFCRAKKNRRAQNKLSSNVLGGPHPPDAPEGDQKQGLSHAP